MSKLDSRLAKLEALPPPPPKSRHDFSRLDPDELRFVASLRCGTDGVVDLAPLNDAQLARLEAIIIKSGGGQDETPS